NGSVPVGQPFSATRIGVVGGMPAVTSARSRRSRSTCSTRAGMVASSTGGLETSAEKVVADKGAGAPKGGPPPPARAPPTGREGDVALRHRSDPDVDRQTESTDLVLGGEHAIHQRVEHVGLRSVHEREVRLVRDLDRGEPVTVPAHDLADERGPPVELEAGV